MSHFFAYQAATDARLLKRSCQELIGICEGMLVDGDLSDTEVVYLKNWLEENDQIAFTWPGEVVYKRIVEVLGDEKITEEERKYLTRTLQELVGGSFVETGSTPAEPTSFPIEHVDSVDFAGKTFCFTGTFIFGTRPACHKATEKIGGIAAPRITRKLDYLVIGTLSTRSWANTSFGRKIEKAVELKETGCPITIIDERAWVKGLPEQHAI